jgi:hypothetical protein
MRLVEQHPTQSPLVFLIAVRAGAAGAPKERELGWLAVSSEYRMLEETADGENGFQGANTVLVSSTVSPAAMPRRALNAKAVAPGRPPSTQVAGS